MRVSNNERLGSVDRSTKVQRTSSITHHTIHVLTPDPLPEFKLFARRMKMNELNGILSLGATRRGLSWPAHSHQKYFPIEISHHVKHLVFYIIHPFYQSLRRMENEFNVQQSINYSIITTSCRVRGENVFIVAEAEMTSATQLIEDEWDEISHSWSVVVLDSFSITETWSFYDASRSELVGKLRLQLTREPNCALPEINWR